MAPDIVCPRCGHTDTFIKGFLPDTCVCRVCQSQLDWREIPGMGPDCRPLEDAAPSVDAAAAASPGTPDEAGSEAGGGGSE